MSDFNDSNVNQKDNSQANNFELNKNQLGLKEVQNINGLKEFSLQIEENYNQFQKNKSKAFCQKFKNLINYLDIIDKKISRPLHRFSPSFKIECIFYLFARLFNIDSVIIYLISFLIYSVLKYKNGYMVLIPICHVICGALTTIILKIIIRRPRPILSANRYFKLKENTHSMPSGDSLQAGVFATMIILYNNNIFRFFSILLIPAAMSGRVFYNLHYWFDCIIGASIGIIITILTYRIINTVNIFNELI